MGGCAIDNLVPKPSEESGYPSNALSTTPYASLEELESLTNQSPEYFYWRASRAFALISLEDFRSLNNWYDAYLSDRPIIIYGADGKPLYYEWRVILGSNEIGAITGNIRKSEGPPITHVLKFATKYNPFSKGGNVKIISRNYPFTSYGIVTKSGEVIDVDDSNNTNQDLTWEYILTHPHEFTNEYVNIDMVISKVLEIMESNKQMYNEMEEIMSNLVYVSTNDEELENFFKETSTITKSHNRYEGRVAGSDSHWETRWWDIYRTLNSLNWNTWLGYNLDPHANRYPAYLWCGPTAGAIFLRYYGYTNKIRIYVVTNTTGVYTNQGLTLFGNAMGIVEEDEWFGRNKKDGGTTYSELINALRWATDGVMNFEYYNASDWWFFENQIYTGRNLIITVLLGIIIILSIENNGRLV